VLFNSPLDCWDFVIEFNVKFNVFFQVRLISLMIHILEKYLFEPKIKRALASAFMELGIRLNFDEKKLIFFDIGANKGQTIKMLKKISCKSLIYSFEPDPIVFKELVKKNRNPGVNFFNIAVGDSSGRYPFYISPLNETSSLIMPDLLSAYNKKKSMILGMNIKRMYAKTEVDVTTIDEFVLQHKINHIDLLKLDVEGAEFQALLGAKNSFRKNMISIVQYEFQNNDLRPSQKQAIETLLSHQGFRKFCSIKHSFSDFYDVIYVKQNRVAKW